MEVLDAHELICFHLRHALAPWKIVAVLSSKIPHKSTRPLAVVCVFQGPQEEAYESMTPKDMASAGLRLAGERAGGRLWIE